MKRQPPAALALVVVAVLAFSHLVVAQANKSPAKPNPKSPEEIATSRVQSLATKLNLTPEQQAKITPIFIDQERQWASVKIGGNSGTKFLELQNAAYEKMRPILTPEQNETFSKLTRGRTTAGATNSHARSAPAQLPKPASK